MDTYKSFNELAEIEIAGIDYSIEYQECNSKLTVLAIHGGNIEIGTSELAKEVAGKLGATFYTLKGLKQINNRKLHVTSAKFDEPIALRLVKKALYTVSIHGAWGDEPCTYMGGRDSVLKELTARQLMAAGFLVKEAPDEINGDHLNNIANRNQRGVGLQLELTEAQRYMFFTNNECSSSCFFRYAQAIETGVRQFIRKHEA